MTSLFCISGVGVTVREIKGPLSIGGSQSSGLQLNALKEKDDYAIVFPSPNGLIVHPLKSGVKGSLVVGPIELQSVHSDAGSVLKIGDLTLFCGQSSFQSTENETHVFDDYAGLMAHFTDSSDLTGAMNLLLATATRRFEMEKGLVIVKSANGEFRVISKSGVDQDDLWMSESLVLQTLKERKPKFIRNIIGSGFDHQKSLVATGFVSVFSWPLVVRGEVFGVLVVGSKKPHSGLSDAEAREAEVLVQLSALMLSFHLRDLKAQEEVRALRKSIETEESPFLTEHPSLIQTCEYARRVAGSDLSVLIQGETGVGKELLANWIHRKSDRTKGPMVAVNCGAIPAELLESLLFGHKKGAFTGAHSDQAGKFQLANGGTLFLDEIADLTLPMQVKLLRVLQEKVVEPVGSNRPIKTDVRLVAASHKNLQAFVSKGLFREDLYYRLAEVTLFIPSLRERPSDIVLLATDFRKRFAPDKRFSAAAWDWLKTQEWRGNVRQLMSSIKRASVLSLSTEIEVDDIIAQDGKRPDSPSAINAWLGGRDLEDAKFQFLKAKVKHALHLSSGNRTRAAELLGVTSRTLFRYLEDMKGDLNIATTGATPSVTGLSHDGDSSVLESDL